MKYSEKPKSEQSLEHIYASIHSDGQSSRSKGFSLSSNNSTHSSDPSQPKPPIRVLSVDKLSSSSPDGARDGTKKWRLSRSESPGMSRSSSPTTFSTSTPAAQGLNLDKIHLSALDDSCHTDKDQSTNDDINTDDSDEDFNQAVEHTKEMADSNKTDDYPATMDDIDTNKDIDQPVVQSRVLKEICDNDIYNDNSKVNEDDINLHTKENNSISQISEKDNNLLSNKKHSESVSNGIDSNSLKNEKDNDSLTDEKDNDSISNEKDKEDELLDNVTKHDMDMNGDIHPVKTIVPESVGSGEFLLATLDNNNKLLRSKIEDNFLTDEQIKEEAISAELY